MGAATWAREGEMSQIRQSLEQICDAFNAHDLDRI